MDGYRDCHGPDPALARRRTLAPDAGGLMVTDQYTAPVGHESSGDRTDPAAYPLNRTDPLVTPSQFESSPLNLARFAACTAPVCQLSAGLPLNIASPADCSLLGDSTHSGSPSPMASPM